MPLQFVCPVAKCKYDIRFLTKNFSHAWKTSVLAQLLLYYKFIEDNCINVFIHLEDVHDELPDLGLVTSFLFDSVYASEKRGQEPIIIHLSDFRKQRRFKSQLKHLQCYIEHFNC